MTMGAALLLKLLLVPALIYAVTIAGRKWGPAIAGWLSAFPIVAGPILLVLTLEQGRAFGAAAAEGTLLAVLAILVFGLAYVFASARYSVRGAMPCALLAYALAVSVLEATRPSLPWCFALVVCALLIAPRLFPHVPLPAAPAGARPSDLPWRMVAAAALVLAVTFGAAHLGARMSGFLAMFPVMGTILTGFSHHYAGRAFAVALLRGMVFGYFAFATFCLLVSLLLPGHSIAMAFSTALGCAFLVQLRIKRFVGHAPHRSIEAAPSLLV
jgi:hypothetical protein